ncbi:MAG: Undecaprenol kinase [Owenweeksia sp. TMED14]|nr:MAG: Undecaprenol kinase [Owenweeksia sp. TMED14]|tara:strand:+ start:700 stop:1062 length:363 start_codon:yes stop_codon:yes gene_type:complete
MNKHTIIQSFKFAINGFIVAAFTERNLKLHLLSAITVIIAGVFFQISLAEWNSVVIAISLVFISELFNTSIETLSDTLHPEIHKGIQHTKDIAASAVVFASLCSLTIGVIIFGPHLLNYF